MAEDYLNSQNYFDPDFGQQCELLAEDSQKSLLESSDAKDCDEYAEEQQKDYDEESGEKLDPAGLHYAKRINEAADQMATLIDDLTRNVRLVSVSLPISLQSSLR